MLWYSTPLTSCGDRNKKWDHPYWLKASPTQQEKSQLDCGDQRWVGDASDFSKEYKANSNYFSYKWREEEVNRVHSQEWMLQRINKVITEEDSGHPLKALPELEIHKAVFDCKPEKIPGPDGFQRNLLKSGTSSKKTSSSTWKKSGRGPGSVNSTFLTLIPKFIPSFWLIDRSSALWSVPQGIGTKKKNAWSHRLEIFVSLLRIIHPRHSFQPGKDRKR